MIGVDEVGRGSLAGPLLVVAARQVGNLPEGLADSKLLNRLRRQELFEMLDSVCQFGEGWVSAEVIDKHGLANALRSGVKRALKSLQAAADDEVIMDGSVNYIPRSFINSRCIINGDASIPIVSAAAIYGKVKRDRFMIRLATVHDAYGFETNVGYGTARHLVVLSERGPLAKIHRLSFEPLRSLHYSGL